MDRNTLYEWFKDQQKWFNRPNDCLTSQQCVFEWFRMYFVSRRHVSIPNGDVTWCKHHCCNGLSNNHGGVTATHHKLTFQPQNGDPKSVKKQQQKCFFWPAQNRIYPTKWRLHAFTILNLYERTQKNLSRNIPQQLLLKPWRNGDFNPQK